MEIKFNKEIYLSLSDIKNIIITYLHTRHNLSGIFDVSFDIHTNTDQNCTIEGASIRISENEYT